MPQFGKTREIIVTPTVSVSPAYTAGDSVGGENVIAALGSQTRRGVLKSLVVVDNGNQKANLTILIMRAAMVTAPVDNAAFAPTAADLLNTVAKINVATADYETINSKAVACIELSRSITGEAAATLTQQTPARLWVYILTTGTPTYTAVDNLKLVLGFLAD